MPNQRNDSERIPVLSKWKAPWEVDENGVDIPADDQEVDTERLKKYLHGLLRDKEESQTRSEELTEQVETLTAERDDFKGKADASGKDETDVVKELRSQLAAAEKKASAAPGKSIREIKLEVGLERGLSLRQALRLAGNNQQEIEDDAEEMIEEYGIGKQKDDAGGEGDGEAETSVANTTPRRPGRNNASKTPDVNKANDGIAEAKRRFPELAPTQ